MQPVRWVSIVVVSGVILLGVGGLACLGTPDETALSTSANVASDSGSGFGSDKSHGPLPACNTVQLSPHHLLLPRAPLEASGQVKDFYNAASRAVHRIYKEDNDDPALLWALQAQLNERPALRPLQPIWQDIFTTALDRTHTLQALSPTLRALHRAMAQAYFDEATHVYRQVDLKACDQAFTRVPTDDPALLNFTVTLEPLGPLSLASFQALCQASRTQDLQERRMPGQPASETLQRRITYLYHHAHLGGYVRKVAILHPWHPWHSDAGPAPAYATLQAVVGVYQPHQPDEPCFMEELEIRQPSAGAASHADLTLVHAGQPNTILCNQLR